MFVCVVTVVVVVAAITIWSAHHAVGRAGHHLLLADLLTAASAAAAVHRMLHHLVGHLVAIEARRHRQARRWQARRQIACSFFISKKFSVFFVYLNVKTMLALI